MKVFFTAAISGLPEYGHIYKAIVEKLQSLGHEVRADHILKGDREKIRAEDDESRVQWYKKTLKWISEADVVVSDVSFPSINVGHEISIALEKSIPVIVAYKKGHHQVLLEGITNEKFFRLEYETKDQLVDQIVSFLDYAQDQSDTRFNFFISPKHQNYLDWISKNRKIPRAVYLRRLIEEDMKRNRDFD